MSENLFEGLTFLPDRAYSGLSPALMVLPSELLLPLFYTIDYAVYRITRRA